MDIGNEGRFLASQLDQSRTNEVVNRLHQDAQLLGPGGYSALLKTINQYDQKGVGDDLIIVNTPNGQEALIKPHAVDVGHIFQDAPPPPPQGPPAAYYEGAPPPPPRSDAGCVVASTLGGAVVGNLLSNWRNKVIGTVAGAAGGAVVGSAACPH
jgi:Glycine zipper 2TM domain